MLHYCIYGAHNLAGLPFLSRLLAAGDASGPAPSEGLQQFVKFGDCVTLECSSELCFVGVEGYGARCPVIWPGLFPFVSIGPSLVCKQVHGHAGASIRVPQGCTQPSLLW